MSRRILQEGIIYTPDGTILFYCRKLDKHLATPPGDLELRIEQIPRFSCYNCNNGSCSFRQENQESLTRLIDGILNSRNGYRKHFIVQLYQYKKTYTPLFL